MNWSAWLIAEVPAGVVTVTSTVPDAPAGLTAVISVSDTCVNDVAALPPNLTAVAPDNPQPVMITVVPPVPGPDVGTTSATTGAPV